MKLAIVLVLVTMFVTSQAFTDNVRGLALFNTMSGRPPLDLSMFGMRNPAAGTTMGRRTGLGNLGMLFMLGGDGFFGM